MNLRYLLVAIVTAVVVFGLFALRDNMSDRKAEAHNTTFKLTEPTERTTDPAEWGKNFPRQYDSYKRTVDMERTRYGGSEADPGRDRRRRRAQDHSNIEQDPRLKTMWNGYAFAIDFREDRGHAYMLHDQRETDRVLKKPQVGACLHCHASITVAYRQAGIDAGAPGTLDEPLLSAHGQEQLMTGFPIISAMPYEEASAKVEHPVTCLDCHDPAYQPAAHHAPRAAARPARPGDQRRSGAAPGVGGEVARRRPRRSLRPEHAGQPPGTALAGLRPVPRRVLLRFEGDAVLPLAEGPEGRADRSGLRRTPIPRRHAVPRTSSTSRAAPARTRRSIRSSRPGARACTPAPASPAPTATCRTSAKAP